MTMRTATLTVALALSLTAGNPGLARAAVPAVPTPAMPVTFDIHGDAMPPGATLRLGTHRWRHGGPVVFVAYAPDDKGLITASQDGTVRLWDLATGKEIRRFGNFAGTGDILERRRAVAYQANMVASAAIAPDGQHLAVGLQDGNIHLFDVETGKQVQQMKTNPQAGLAALAFTPDGKSLISKTYNMTLQRWNVADGKEARKFGDVNNGARRIFNGGASATMRVSADGKTLMSGSVVFDKNNQLTASLQFFDLETGKETSTLEGPANGAQALAIAPDGKHVAWAANDGTAHVYDIEARKLLRQLTVNQANGFFGSSLAFAPDGTTLVSRNYDQVVRVWDFVAGKELMQIGQAAANYNGLPCNLAFSADGKTVASGVGYSTVRQWSLATGKEVGSQGGHNGPVLGLVLAADGKTFATRGIDNTVHVWDTATGKESHRFTGGPMTQQAAFAADGRSVAFGGYDGKVAVYGIKDGKEILSLQALNGPNANIAGLALSADGKVLVVRGYDMTTRLFDTASGRELRQLVEQQTLVNGQPVYYGGQALMSFTRDGSVLAIASSNQQFYRGEGKGGRLMAQKPQIRLWDVATGRLVRHFESDKPGITAITYAPDGRTLATANQDGTMSLYETASGKERHQFKAGGVVIASTLVYSPDGRTLASTSVYGTEHVVRFHDALTGKELPTQLKGHQNPINALAFAADGKSLLTGSQDTTALLWDVTALSSDRAAPAVELNDEQLQAAWTKLASGDGKAAYETMSALAAYPAPALKLLGEHLKPLPAVDGQHLAACIADLESDKFAVRQRATADLEKLAELAEPALKEVLAQGPSLEIRQRIERLMEKMVTGKPLPADQLRLARGLEILERLGTPEARRLLEEIAKGAPGARFTRDAQATLERLGK